MCLVIAVSLTRPKATRWRRRWRCLCQWLGRHGRARRLRTLRRGHLGIRERANATAGDARGPHLPASARARNRAGPAGGEALRRRARRHAGSLCADRSMHDLEMAVDRLGARYPRPGVTAMTARAMADRFGARCRGAEPARVPLIYEGFVEFEAEFSVILVRGQDGEIRFWDPTRNAHERDPCHLHPARGRDDRGAGGRGPQPCPTGCRCAEICRSADARILRHARRTGVQRDGAARAIRGIGASKARSRASSRTTFARSPVCRWETLAASRVRSP